MKCGHQRSERCRELVRGEVDVLGVLGVLGARVSGADGDAFDAVESVAELDEALQSFLSAVMLRLLLRPTESGSESLCTNHHYRYDPTTLHDNLKKKILTF